MCMIDGPGAVGQGPGARAGGHCCGQGRGPRAEVPRGKGQGPRAKGQGLRAVGTRCWNQEFDRYTKISLAILLLETSSSLRRDLSLITRSSNYAGAQG